ncbi:putative thiol peroxidase, partial [Haemophilus influenzae]
KKIKKKNRREAVFLLC